MATFAQIRAARLYINDPPGVIDIVEVADTSVLPVVPAKQTAYLAQDTGLLWVTDLESGLVPADYHQPELWLSDEMIGDIVDAYGADTAIVRCLRLILARVASKMNAVRIAAGQDSTEYNTIRDLHAHYKDLIKIFQEQKAENANVATGQWLPGRRQADRIAGGNL